MVRQEKGKTHPFLACIPTAEARGFLARKDISSRRIPAPSYEHDVGGGILRSGLARE
jgi:hypothetical protein